MDDNLEKNISISIESLDDSKIKPEFIFEYVDQKGVISKISSILAENDINIANMSVTRNENVATMKCQVESTINDNVKKQLLSAFNFIKTEFINL